ncbi:MAG: cytochrome c [Planctomycetes bacterium]|nr:cytochrome c [Planctomycetota bacterium]
MAEPISAGAPPPASRATLAGVALFVTALAILLIFFVPDAEPKVASRETDPAKIYLANCAVCHGPGGEGKGGFPRIIGTKLTEAEVAERIRDGKGEMPAHRTMTAEQVEKVARWVKGLGQR